MLFRSIISNSRVNRDFTNWNQQQERPKHCRNRRSATNVLCGAQNKGEGEAQRGIANLEASSFGFETTSSISIFSVSFTPSTVVSIR